MHIDRSYSSPHFNNRQPSAILLHATGVDFDETIAFLSGQKGVEVSCHYVIDRDGTIYQLVNEEKRAFHAGAGVWRQITDMNSVSIGIELVMPSDEEIVIEGAKYPEKVFSHVDFSQEQIQATIDLVKDIQSRYPRIKKENIIGHHEMSFKRKFDPGPCFPWDELAQAEVCWMPSQDLAQDQTPLSAQETKAFLQNIKDYGYDAASADRPDLVKALVASFQMRYDQDNVTGVPTQGNLKASEWLLDKAKAEK